MRARWGIAYLVTHPIQYQAPLLRHLAACDELDLTVFFLSDASVAGYRDPGFDVRVKWDVPLLEGYRHEFLPALGGLDQLGFARPLTLSLRPVVDRARFDALWVHGYAHQACLRAMLLAFRNGLPVLLRGESHLASHRRTRLRAAVKDVLLRRLFRHVAGFLAIGSLNREYYLHYGVPARRIFDVPYAVDNGFFAQRAAEAGAAREALRASLDLEAGRPVLLCASKLIPRKRPIDLIEAHAGLPGKASRPYLLFVGDGPLRDEMAARTCSLGTTDSVRFAGFRNQTELPAFYDLCDVFVLPSEHEPWGLVVNEVMNAGRPVVVSDAVGAGADLVTSGETGFVFPAGDAGALGQCLEKLLADPEGRRRMGTAARERVSCFDFERDRQGLLAALDAVVAGPPPGGGR